MNLEGAKARLERYIREINAAQSKAIVLRNDLSNDYELEDFDNDYAETIEGERDDLAFSFGESRRGYFTKMRNDIDNVIEANYKLLAHLYAAKRSYAKADGEIRTIQANRRGGFGF